MPEYLIDFNHAPRRAPSLWRRLAVNALLTLVAWLAAFGAWQSVAALLGWVTR